MLREILEVLYRQIIGNDPNEAGFGSANGSTIIVLPPRQIELRLSNIKVMHEVLVVCGFEQSFIIGNDFLSNHKCDILYSAGVLNLADGYEQM